MPGRKTRSFGSIRRLPSGRWQARYRGLDGVLRSAPHTFANKADAKRWLALTEAELLGGRWIDPQAGRVPFLEYAAAWVDERGLRPKTIQLYRYLLRAHLRECFGGQTIASITEADIRRWRADLLSAGVSAVTTAKAYRLLKSIFATAVEDSLIRRNPCRIKGASVEKSPERPVLTVAEVYALAVPSASGTGRWSCSPASAACAGENWQGSSAPILTATAGLSAWHGSFAR
jgi:hypothetical protein